MVRPFTGSFGRKNFACGSTLGEFTLNQRPEPTRHVAKMERREYLGPPGGGGGGGGGGSSIGGASPGALPQSAPSRPARASGRLRACLRGAEAPEGVTVWASLAWQPKDRLQSRGSSPNARASALVPWQCLEQLQLERRCAHVGGLRSTSGRGAAGARNGQRIRRHGSIARSVARSQGRHDLHAILGLRCVRAGALPGASRRAAAGVFRTKLVDWRFAATLPASAAGVSAFAHSSKRKHCPARPGRCCSLVCSLAMLALAGRPSFPRPGGARV